MIYITWSKREKQMKVDSSKIGSFYMPCSCVVRNELNGWRPQIGKLPREEVVYGITQDNRLSNVPVMPRQFPNGIWNITWVEARTNPYQRPLVIMTDAHQELDIWELGPDDGYLRKTGKTFDDWMYGIHLSSSRTTQGCIRALNERYFFILADLVGEDVVKQEDMKIEIRD